LKRAIESALGKQQDRQRRHAGTGELSADVAREPDDETPAAAEPR
jgi:hypothetical protein